MVKYLELYFHLDFFSLNDYLNGSSVEIGKIRDRFITCIKKDNFRTPSHLIDSQLLNLFPDDSEPSLVKIYTKVFPEFSGKFIEFSASKLFIKPKYFYDWQNLVISKISPLFLSACRIVYESKDNSLDLNKLNNLFRDDIYSNTKYSSILSPEIDFLDDLFKKNTIVDPHVHLEEITEPEIIWLQTLVDIDNYVHQFTNERIWNYVSKQMEGLDISISSVSFKRMIQRASVIRNLIYEKVINKKKIKKMDTSCFETSKHPFSYLINETEKYNLESQLPLECLMYVIIIKYLRTKNDLEITKLFHEYLLINNLFRQLLIFRNNQIGYKDFKIVASSRLKRTYKLYQLNINQLKGNFVHNRLISEVRFSPNSRKDYYSDLMTHCCVSDEESKFFLIATFLRTWEKERKYDLKAKSLIESKKNKSEFDNYLIGIDVAADELAVSPDVFAPIYSLLRSNSFKHFTFHAGEEFYHILDGLRYIYESILFCDLHKGDRISHASALGIDVSEWHELVGNYIVIPQGRYMDDLLFCYYFINDRKIWGLNKKINKLKKEIEKYYEKIYGKKKSIEYIQQGWLSRQIDFKNKSMLDGEIEEYINDYNDEDYKKEYIKPVNIYVFEHFSVKEIRKIQKELFYCIKEREIIIETIPTGNFKMGYYRTFSDYQLFNWLSWKKDCLYMIGTDNPGIFTTNIYNEYALIYCYLRFSKNMRIKRIETLLYNLAKNSKQYSFYKEQKKHK